MGVAMLWDTLSRLSLPRDCGHGLCSRSPQAAWEQGLRQSPSPCAHHCPEAGTYQTRKIATYRQDSCFHCCKKILDMCFCKLLVVSPRPGLGEQDWLLVL